MPSVKTAGIAREFFTSSGRFLSTRLVGRGGTQAELAPSSPEFVASVETKGNISLVTTSECKVVSVDPLHDGELEAILETRSAPLLWIRLRYKTDENASTITKTVEIKNVDKELITLVDLAVEAVDLETTHDRGGLGQPLFTPGFFWAIEWPAGSTTHDGKGVRSWQYPATPVAPGETFASEPCVVGSAEPGKEREAFLAYWDTKTRRKRHRIFPLYCDWAAHDELSGRIPLTTEKARELFDVVRQWKAKGVDLETYVLDTFWYQPSRKNVYTRFNAFTWPGGEGEKFLADIDRAGLRLGLWLDIAGYNVIGKRFRGIIDDALEQFYRLGGPMGRLASSKALRALSRAMMRIFGQRGTMKPCLIDGDFARHVEAAFLHHVKENKLSLVKVDFANFRCSNPSHHHEPGRYAYEQSIKRFREMVVCWRAANPDLAVIAYNGFTTHQGYIEQPTPERVAGESAISPFWLSWIETVYAGDPRLSDVPTPTERSSIACYSDTQFRLFVDSLILPRCIDDHSVLIGNTPTIMGIGKKDWTDAWIVGNVGRGHLNFFVYGDVSLIDTDADFRFLHEAWRFLHENAEACETARFIGGDPDKGEVYGSVLPGKDKSHVVLHNPSFVTRKFTIPLDGGPVHRIYPRYLAERGTSVNLAPAEVAMFQVGGEHPTVVFDVPSRYEDGQELPILHELYKRLGDSRDVRGTVIVPPHEAGKHELHVSVSLTQSIYAWRELWHPAKELKFSARMAGKTLPHRTIPAAIVCMLSSWGTFQVPLDPSSKETRIDFAIRHPWDRLVKARVRAFLLRRGERE